MDKKKLALIHIIKKELNLSDEEYRRILFEAAGVHSAKDLDTDKFRKLMNYFVRSRHYRSSPEGLTLRQKMFIKNLAHDLGWDADHINNFAHKYYHAAQLESLARRDATKMIEALKNIKKHKQESEIHPKEG